MGPIVFMLRIVKCWPFLSQQYQNTSCKNTCSCLNLHIIMAISSTLDPKKVIFKLIFLLQDLLNIAAGDLYPIYSRDLHLYKLESACSCHMQFHFQITRSYFLGGSDNSFLFFGSILQLISGLVDK